MSSRRDTIALMRQGYLPSQIALVRDRAISTIIQHIWQQLGESEVRPLEVILTYGGERSSRLETLFRKHKEHKYKTFERYALRLGYAYEEVKLYYDIMRSDSLRGDTYVYISNIELLLHNFVKKVLKSIYNSSEAQWWRLGVPQTIRKSCASLREEDEFPMDVYCYTTFINLSQIIDSQWSVFGPKMAGVNKRTFLRELKNLNQLRNFIMHPVKGHVLTIEELRGLKIVHDVLSQTALTPY